MQRLRTDWAGRGRILVHTKKNVAAGRSRDVWALTPSSGTEFREAFPETPTIRLVDLTLWFGREQDVANLDSLLEWFNDLFQPDQAGLLGTVYTEDVPDEYRQVPFAADPVDDSTAQQLGSLPPAPTVDGTLPDLVTRLETRLTAKGYQLSPGLVRRVLTAWLRGDIVILVGQPGTGKTMFAGLLGRAMEAELNLDTPLLVPIRADFDESEFIGYERLDGKPELRQFATEILSTARPLEARVVVLEEFNLALVENYLASVLVAAQEQERLIRLPAGQHSQLPIDTFIIATCNSYRDEPETRTRVSSPTKRRSTTITMSNILGDRYDDDPANAVLQLAMQIIKRESDGVRARLDSGRGAQFDALRLRGLEQVTGLESLSAGVRASLVQVSSAILDTSVGRSWFTLGLLKDVVLEIAHAERDEDAELIALGQAIADKLVHQVRGAHADVQDLRDACASLPNAEEISRLLDRMMDGPSDELLPLL